MKETKPRIKSLSLLIDGWSKESPRHSFQDGHLDFVTDKKGEKRGMWGFEIFEGGLREYAEFTKQCLVEGEGKKQENKEKHGKTGQLGSNKRGGG